MVISTVDEPDSAAPVVEEDALDVDDLAEVEDVAEVVLAWVLVLDEVAWELVPEEVAWEVELDVDATELALELILALELEPVYRGGPGMI